MDKPMQLIKHEEGKLELVEETAKFLSEISLPVVVIGICGLVGSGKSSILNRLCKSEAGFAVGKSSEACTSGVWVWACPPINEMGKEEEAFTLFLDTEGLGNPQQESNYDAALFGLVAVLSSYFIFNSIGYIDERAIQQLQLVLNLPMSITNSADFKKQAPTFMWLLRDFNSPDENVHPLEYLEQQLDVRRGIDITSQTVNFITRRITGYFQARDCFFLSAPYSEDDPNNFFNMQTEELLERVLQKAPIKSTIVLKDGVRKLCKLNGSAFIAFTRVHLGRLTTITSFKPKRKDTPAQLEKPIYQRAVDNLDAQIKANILKHEEEMQKKQNKGSRAKREGTVVKQKSREYVVVTIKDTRAVKQKEAEIKETGQEKEGCFGNNSIVTCGCVALLVYLKYFIGFVVFISFIIVLVIIFAK